MLHKLWSNYLSLFNNENIKFFEDIEREVFNFFLLKGQVWNKLTETAELSQE
jgi:hypothetical protein